MSAEERARAPEVSIIAPMHNEADGLDLFAAQLEEARGAIERRNGLRRELIEVIAVDDGSTDATAGRLAALADAGVLRVVAHERNRGLGAALWTGFAAARADVLVTVDADCTYRLAEVADLLALLDDGTSVVTGSPYHPRGRVEDVPPFRLFLSRTLSRLYDIVLGTRIHTYTALFRASRRVAIDAVPIRADGFIAVTHLLVFPLLAGHRIREHPTTLHGRRFGTSKLRVARVIRQHIALLIRLALWRAGIGRGDRAAAARR